MSEIDDHGVMEDVSRRSGATRTYCFGQDVYMVTAAETGQGVFANVRFQDGPIPVAGVNGASVEDLLDIAIHRLKGYQLGPLPDEANADALRALADALKALEGRTRDRVDRGVEGTMEP